MRDLSLLLDAFKEDEQWRYTSTLCEGWPEEDKQLYEQPLDKPFYEIVAKVIKETLDERAGAALFDWVFPPDSLIREIFLEACQDVAQREGVLRLWIWVGSSVRSFFEFSELERSGRVSWEGFWVREWADDSNRPARVQSPFLALNDWIHVVRRPPGVSLQGRFTVPGRLNVFIVVSNPPAPGVGEWTHLEYLEREDGSGMLRRVHRVFHRHRSVGWVYVLRNPTKVQLAADMREHKPHIVIYLGHGYSNKNSGLVLARGEDAKEFEQVPGLRQNLNEESELEKVFAGKWQTLEKPNLDDEGLPIKERARLVIAFACEAAPAGPGLLQCGVPAVLAMRRKIPDSDETEAMVKQCADLITDESKSIEDAIAELRHFLKEKETRFTDERLHFSVPALYMATHLKKQIR